MLNAADAHYAQFAAPNDVTHYDLLEHPEYLEDEFHGRYEPTPTGQEKRSHGIEPQGKTGAGKHKYIDTKKAIGKKEYRRQEKPEPKIAEGKSELKHDLHHLHSEHQDTNKEAKAHTGIEKPTLHAAGEGFELAK